MKYTYTLPIVLLIGILGFCILSETDDPQTVRKTAATTQVSANSNELTVASDPVSQPADVITQETGNKPDGSREISTAQLPEKHQLPGNDQLAIHHSVAPVPNSLRFFGKGSPFEIKDLPEGNLKKDLLALGPANQIKALEWLRSFSFSGIDAVESLRADSKGGIYYQCSLSCAHCASGSHDAVVPGKSVHDQAAASSIPSVETAESTDVVKSDSGPSVEAAPVSINSPPIYNSKPGSVNTMYLDFNGAVITGKAWNTSRGVASWTAKAYSSDGDLTTFSDAEQTFIRRVWERIAEDYAPFDINVTTDVAFDPDNYTGDKNKVAWNLFCPRVDANGVNLPHAGSGGVAYVGVFGLSNYFSTYQPAFTKAETNESADIAAEAGSHEVGHNMGLSHDTRSNEGYYGGHTGAGAPTWGPIMGTGYNRNLSQWSKGEYYDSKHASWNGTSYDNNPNTNDDLAIIAGKTSYRTDDHGNTNGSATAITAAGDGSFNRTGIIERTSETDVFSFATGAGSVTINANPFKSDTSTWGGNLDINLELYNAGGTLIASNNPNDNVTAAITTTLAAGTYYIHVKPSSAGNASGTGSPYDSVDSTRAGYTVYGSLGQYTISGAFILPGVNIVEAGGTNVVEGGATDTYTISLGTAPTSNVTVSISPNAQVTTSTSSVTFTTANWNTPQTVTVTAVNDTAIEGNHTGIITHAATSADPSFNGVSIGSVIANITDNDDIVLTAPNGGESWMAGSTQNITWTSLMGGNVRLELLRNGSLDSVIIASTPNDGTHPWTIPSGQLPTSEYRVRISSVETPAALDTSLANFTVSPIPSTLASQNFDAASTLPADWSNTTASGTAAWTISTTKSHTPTRSAFIVAPATIASAYLTSAAMAIPAGTTGIQFSFYHDYVFEAGWDGGLLEFSIDGGPWFDVTSSGSGASFGQNGYNLGSVPTNYSSPIAGRSAWSGNSGGFIQTIVNLTDTAKYAGKSLRARWLMGTDNGNGAAGWYVDTVELKGITAGPTVGVVVAQSGGSTNVTEGGATDTYTLSLISQPTANVTVTVTPNSQVSASPTSLTFTTSNWATAQTVTVTAVNDTVNEFAHTGSISHTSSSADANYNNLAITGVTVNITDNDNIAPVVNAGPDQSVELSGTSWSPVDVGPLAWYDANDAATITQVGGAVSQWADKAGTSHMVQATGTKQPVSGTTQINGLNSIAFDGLDDTLKTATNPFGASISNAMLIGVFNIGTITNSTLFSLTGSQSNRWQSHAPYGDGTLYFDCGGSGSPNRISGASGFAASQNRLLGFYCSTTASVQQVWVDGTNTLSDASGHTVNTSSGMALGHDGSTTSGFDNCRMGEVLVINGTVSAENRQKLEGYLAHKWGLAGSLPAAHPYKASSPNNLQALASMDGTASDANSDPLTYAWTVVSGPGAVVFANPAAIDTTATFTVEGTYTLRLTANDSGAQTSDDVVVTVNPSTTNRTVTYNGNGNTGGTVPVDASSPYANGATVTVLGNTGSLTRTGYTFNGWNTAANGTGTAYAPGATFTISTATTLYAQWTANTYTVTFNGNNGVTPNPTTKSVTFGSTYGTLATTSRTGYTFAGWYTAASGGTLVGTGTTVSTAADHTLYAQWTANTYTVTFNGNGGGTPSPASQNATFGSAYGTLATVSRAGYTFNGWFTAASGGTLVTATTTVSTAMNHTLYAQWTANSYTVTFDANGGTTPSPTTKSVTFASTYGTLATTSRTGYAFAGWFTAASGGTLVGSTTTVTNASNHTLYAQWTANTYTVTFDPNGGDAPSPASQNATFGSAYGTLATVTRTGYTFNGWFTAASGGTLVTAATTVSTASNHILYAQWTVTTYTVSYNGNSNTGGTVPSNQTKTYGVDLTLATNSGNLTRTGYTFAGWNTLANGTGTNYAAGGLYTANAAVTLFAKWTPNTYTVTFNSNGGGTPSQTSKTVTFGSTYGTLATTTRAGYTFAGWFTASSGGTQVTTSTTVTNASSHTLYAQWTANTYTVTFDPNGGDVPSPTSKSVTYGATYGTLATVTRTGHTFTGWFTAASGGVQVTSSTTVAITAAQTLYAQWTVNSYTITFDSAGGSAVSPITQNFGTAVTSPAPPTRAGYTFAGWSPAVPATMPANNLTVTAQWTANSYTVTFDPNGGNAPTPTSISVTYNAPYGTLATVSRTGYTFNGWFTAASGGTQVTSGTIVTATANHALYAQWTQNFPEMDVTRGGSPEPSGGYDAITGTSAGTGAPLTYAIANSGTANLALGSPSITNQSNCAVVVNTPPSTSIAPSGSSNLALTVTPTAAGAWSFVVSIVNDDPDENPYLWTVHGVAQGTTTASFTPSADTYINGASTGTNYGTATTFSIWNRTNGSNFRYGLLRFDLASIPTGATVTSASLGFVQNNAVAGSVDVYEATNSWTETGATWTNSSTLIGATSFGTANSPGTVGGAVPDIALNPTGIAKVQSWVTAPSGNYGFGLKTTSSGNGGNIDLRSREDTLANQPKLTVTYTDVPQVAEMHVTRAGAVVADAGTDAVAGSVAGNGTPLTYAIANLGNANLTITTPVSVTGASNCSVQVNAEPASPVASSASTSLVLTVTPAASGAWSANVSIANNDPDEAPYNWTISGTATGGSVYTAWAASSSLSGDNATTTANPDGDNLTNLQEFAFGTNPNSPVSGPLAYVTNGNVTRPGTPVAQNFAAAGQPLEFHAVFARRKDFAAAGLTYTVEFSADLNLWTVDATPPSRETAAGSPGEMDAVSVPFPASVPLQAGGTAAPKFFRVVVTGN